PGSASGPPGGRPRGRGQSTAPDPRPRPDRASGGAVAAPTPGPRSPVRRPPPACRGRHGGAPPPAGGGGSAPGNRGTPRTPPARGPASAGRTPRGACSDSCLAAFPHAEEVAAAAQRVDQARAVRLELAAQLHDVNLEGVRHAVVALVPDVFVDARPRQHLAG